MGEPDRPGQAGVRRAPVPLPAALAADSLEALAAERYTRAPFAYLSVIATVLLASASLPLIHVPVGVRAPGLVRPATEKQEIRAPVSGRISESSMQEGAKVAAGEPLLRLTSGGLPAARERLRALRSETVAAVNDLETLTTFDPGAARPQQSPALAAYAAELKAHLAMVAEQDVRRGRMERELDRGRALMARGVLPPAHLERLEHDLEEQRAAARRLAADDRARWARELLEQRRRLGDIQREWEALRVDERLTVVSSPGEGALEGVATAAVGSYVAAGERIATLVPAAGFRAEAHVDARGVSLIRTGARVRLRVGGYDPGEWGSLTGRVASISPDVIGVGGRPVFRLDVALDRDHLRLPDGRVGPLRHGLPVDVHIIVARPSLYHLLRGRVTDWVRPGGPTG